MILEKKLLSVKETAEYLKVTPQYICQVIHKGALNAERVGKQWVITPSDIKKYIEDNNVCIEPDDHPRKTDDLPEIVALSFFSGAMGLDIGMKKGGISAILTCEFNKYCRMTIETNEPEPALIGDINNYSTDEILEYAKIPKERKVDVIFGGARVKHLVQQEQDGHLMMNVEMYF